MKTTNEAIDVVWKQVNACLSGNIGGGIYKIARPFDSKLEDVVINTLPITGESIQSCVLYINCFVPNPILKIKGKSDNSLPDYARLKSLTASIISQVDLIALPGTFQFVENQAILKNEGVQEHFSSIRIQFMFTGDDES
ncbi:MAG: hypothetical protein KGZ82_04220 [Bacteroidales bacterium]|nr:hypothetical protein [Bacteroidales bacterium]